MFDASTVAQMAAFFAAAEPASKINILKLVKLMYLADREAMRRYRHPISFDDMVSMPHGPVLSRTLNLINGDVDGAAGAVWQYWISDRADHMVQVRRKFTRQDLDHLSEAELAVLDSVWKKFGKLDQWQLRDYTHKHCPEWRDPKDSPAQSISIDEADVFCHLGMDKREANARAQDIRSAKYLLAESASA